MRKFKYLAAFTADTEWQIGIIQPTFYAVGCKRGLCQLTSTMSWRVPDFQHTPQPTIHMRYI
jgi:hypothetical protein